MTNPSSAPAGKPPDLKKRVDHAMIAWLSLAPRVLLVLLIFTILALAVKLLWGPNLALDKTKLLSMIQIAAALLGLLLAGVGFSGMLDSGLAGFLRNLTGAAGGSRQAREIAALRNELRELRALIADHQVPQQPIFTEEEKRTFIDSIRASIRAAGARDIVAELREHLAESNVLDGVRGSTHATLDRLRQERSRIARRGNFNLFVGLVTTVAGVWMLLGYARELSMQFNPATIVSTTPAPSASILEAKRPDGARSNALQGQKSADKPGGAVSYLVMFLPRLSLVLLIELFAYFFLGLYKASLVEVQYIQNEMTSVELRALALQTAVAVSDRESVGEILRAYGIVDRNIHQLPTTSSDVGAADVAKILEAIRQLLGALPKR